MAGLVNCIECGRPVSSKARRCPHCNSNFPVGRKCAVCNIVGKDTEGVQIRVHESGPWLHHACFQKVEQECLSVQYTCPVCGNVEPCKIKKIYRDSLPEQPYFDNPCPKCGHPVERSFWAVECSFCRMYVFPAMSAVPKERIHNLCQMTKATRQAARVTPQAGAKDISAPESGKNKGCMAAMLIFALLLLAPLIYAAI